MSQAQTDAYGGAGKQALAIEKAQLVGGDVGDVALRAAPLCCRSGVIVVAGFGPHRRILLELHLSPGPGYDCDSESEGH